MNYLLKRAVITAMLTAILTGAGIFLKTGLWNESSAATQYAADYAESILSSPLSPDVFGYEGDMAFGDNPLDSTEPTELPGVIEVDDPESLIFDQKLQAIERVPSLRTIDDAAVKLAKAYDDAKGAPKPYIQENGRINFYFGTMSPRIVCKPLRLTDVELEPGETVRNVHISDSVRWSVSGASSGSEKNTATHVILKPQLPDIAANLLIHTDKRTYSIELISVADGQFMPFVGFVYPETPRTTKAADAESWQNLLAQYKRADDIKTAPKPSDPANNARIVNAPDVYADYTIKVIKGKDIPWKPYSVHDSRGKTYISMPDMMQVTEAPVLSIKQNGREQLVNYRVDGSVYIVDRLFDIGILTVGKDRVAIYRTIPVAASGTKP